MAATIKSRIGAAGWAEGGECFITAHAERLQVLSTSPIPDRSNEGVPGPLNAARMAGEAKGLDPMEGFEKSVDVLSAGIDFLTTANTGSGGWIVWAVPAGGEGAARGTGRSTEELTIS